MYLSRVSKIGWKVSISRIQRQTRWWSVEMCCFDEKAMLQCTQEKKRNKCQKHYNNNDHEMYIEWDTHIKEETIKNSRSSSSEDQQHDNIALCRLKCTSRPPLRYNFEDLVSYALITYSRDRTTFQEALHI
jgi:hypothetical protein